MNAATSTSATMSRPLSIFLAVLVCVSFLLLFLVSLFQCQSRNRGRPSSDQSETTTNNPKVGHTIPVIIYHRSSSASTQPPPSSSPAPPPASDGCSICLSDFAEGDEIRALPRCDHVFHKDCIDQWLPAKSSSCPICRIPVVDCMVDPTRSTSYQANLHLVMAPPHFFANLQ